MVGDQPNLVDAIDWNALLARIEAVESSIISLETKSGTVTMDMTPYTGASRVFWFANGIDIDADNEKIGANGNLPENAVRFRIRIFYWNTIAGGTTMFGAIGSHNCSSGSMSWAHLNEGGISFPTANGGIECYVSDWYTPVTPPCTVGVAFYRTAGQRVIVYAPQMDWDTEDA